MRAWSRFRSGPLIMHSSHRPSRRIARWGLLPSLVVAGALAACYPGSTDLADEEYDIVLTVADREADFGSYRTYVMPDTVLHIEGGDSIELSRDYDDLVLSLVETNMDAMGYDRVLDPEADGSDLILLVAAVGTESVDWFYGYWDWWGWWPGWGYYPPAFGPGWGWGYPPGYVGAVRIEQGSLLLTLVDPAAADEGSEELPVVWAAAVRGLLSGGNAQARLTDAINQAFIQSASYMGAR
jgi:hypothetical protein